MNSRLDATLLAQLALLNLVLQQRLVHGHHEMVYLLGRSTESALVLDQWHGVTLEQANSNLILLLNSLLRSSQ